MGEPTVSRLRREHLEQLARMRLRVFKTGLRSDISELATYLGVVFLENPWCDGDSLSRVVTQGDRVIGCIGLIPRPFRFRDRTILVAAVSHVMVDPDFRGMGLGSQLLHSVFNGEQDLTLSDVSNQALRRLWENQGGVTHALGCLAWERSFRPLRTASSVFAALPELFPLRALARPMSRLLDPTLIRSQRSRLHVAPSPCTVQPCEPMDQFDSMQAILASTTLSPIYTEESFSWLLRQLMEHPAISALKGAVVISDDGSEIGWSIMVAREEVHGEIVQMVAIPGTERLVVQALFHDASRRGIQTLHGRASPSLVEGLSARGAKLAREDPWVLVHSRDPEILIELLAGSSALSRLDGEWWVTA